MYIKLEDKYYELSFEDYYLIEVTEDFKVIQTVKGDVKVKKVDKYLVNEELRKAWKH